MGMAAVLGVVVYQGFVCTTRFEVSQLKEELVSPAFEQREVDRAYQDRSNSAPLYAAAAGLQDGHPGVGQQVTLDYFRRNQADIEQRLAGQHLAFDLLHRAAARKRCNLSYQELSGRMNFLGLRSLVQTVCLEMMRRAEHGEISEATVLARDVRVMIERLDQSPSALRHAICLALSDQLANTVQELHAAYPGQGFEQLWPDLDSLALTLEAGLADCVAAERVVVAGEFDKIRAGDLKGAMVPATFFGLRTDLQVYQAELAYLRASQRIESAVKEADPAKVEAALASLKGDNEIAFAMTVNWTAFHQRHQERLKELRPARF